MIAIVNVSPDAPVTGINQYEVRINRRVIAKFEHFRHLDGLAQCLRDAADAVERSIYAKQHGEKMKLTNYLLGMEDSDETGQN
jgi:hypothetical protein